MNKLSRFIREWCKVTVIWVLVIGVVLVTLFPLVYVAVHYPAVAFIGTGLIIFLSVTAQIACEKIFGP